MMFPCAARIWTFLMCRLRVVPVWSERTATLCRGQAFSSFGNKAFTASTTAMRFVPGCFEHENDGKGRFAQPASSEFSGGQRPTLRVKVNRERSPPTVSRSMTSRTDLTNQYTDLPQENFDRARQGSTINHSDQLETPENYKSLIVA